MWEGMDVPLSSGGWDCNLAGPLALPYSPGSNVPRNIDRAEMTAITDEFVESTKRAADAGFRCARVALRSWLPFVLLLVSPRESED